MREGEGERERERERERDVIYLGKMQAYVNGIQIGVGNSTNTKGA